MKISLKSLKNIGQIDISLEELVSLIKTHIGEVESYHNIEDDYKDIVVAEITKKEEHPDADKLCIYHINYGDGKTVVVAGDKQLEVGDKVAYLKPGSTVPYSIYSSAEPMIISKRNMRGIDSNGMLGSKMELNVGMNHKHVMKLDKNAKIGDNFANYYGLDDSVIDIENKALTNRGDLFGLIGIAREISAIIGKKFETPDWYYDYEKNLKPKENCLNIVIKNDAEVLCPRYCAIVMDNINIKQSPEWLKSTLQVLGIPCINNIVDITNYISYLVGQPLHAFDYDKVLNGTKAEIHVRMAKQGESILALDKKTHVLDDKVVVIADENNPIGIAGIMGGRETCIDEKTKRIIIESAMFDKTSIRKSTMRLGISTDSATKFKHSLDSNHCMCALKKSVTMMEELANGKIASEIIDIQEPQKSQIDLDIELSKINTILGTDLNKKTVQSILTNLGYEIIESDKDTIHIKVPTWRQDVSIREDVYEDIGRIYNYNNIELLLPTRDIKPIKRNELFELKKYLREILSASGANETDTYSFIGIDDIKKCTQDPNISFVIKNPLAPELSLMRTCINQSLLSKASENILRGFEKFVLYEMNIPHQKGLLDGENLPLENWYLSLILIDKTNSYDGSPYYLAKKYLDKLFNSLNMSDVKYSLLSESEETKLDIAIKNLIDLFDLNTSSLIYINNQIVGVVGEYKNIVKENFKLPKYSAGFEINLNTINQLGRSNKEYIDTPIFPSSMKDLCFEIEDNVKYEDINKEVMQIINKGKLYGTTECVDIYKKDEQDITKRITIRIEIRHFDKTLESKEIELVIKEIDKIISKKFKGKLI